MMRGGEGRIGVWCLEGGMGFDEMDLEDGDVGG